MNCECCELNKKITSLIFETKHWYAILNKDQALLGKSIVASKRHCETLKDLTLEEWKDLKIVINKFESSVAKAFNSKPFNWSCLMNGAYETKTPAHVHWHVNPRYEKEINYAGLKFIDPTYGNPHDYKRINVVPEKILNKIIKDIKKELK